MCRGHNPICLILNRLSISILYQFGLHWNSIILNQPFHKINTEEEILRNFYVVCWIELLKSDLNIYSIFMKIKLHVIINVKLMETLKFTVIAFYGLANPLAIFQNYFHFVKFAKLINLMLFLWRSLLISDG